MQLFWYVVLGLVARHNIRGKSHDESLEPQKNVGVGGGFIEGTLLGPNMTPKVAETKEESAEDGGGVSVKWDSDEDDF